MEEAEPADEELNTTLIKKALFTVFLQLLYDFQTICQINLFLTIQLFHLNGSLMTSPSNVTVAITLAVVLLSLFIFFWIRFILSDELPDNFATVMARTERMLPLLRIDLEPLDEAPGPIATELT